MLKMKINWCFFITFILAFNLSYAESLDCSDDIILPLFNYVTSEEAAVHMAIDTEVLEFIVMNEPESFNLSIPVENGVSINLNLFKAPIFNTDFKIKTSSGKNINTTTIGVAYWGMIDGNESATFLFNGNQVFGSFHYDQGYKELHRTEHSNSYYELVDKSKMEFETGCVTDTNALVEYLPKTETEEFIQNKPISVYLEVNSEFPWLRSSGINILSMVVFTFNQTALLYKNEEISIKISEIFVWDAKSPYGGSSIKQDKNNPSMYQYLAAFKKERKTFNGDIAMLFVELSSIGNGVAAKVGGLCDDIVTNRMGVVKTYWDKDPYYPNYSRGMEFFSHELGHLFGSVHTNQCAWNNNNTSLDNCRGNGKNCTSPEVDYTISEDSFTIMSNCKKRNNLRKGLGVQPGNRIRRFIANAKCIQTVDGWDKELTLYHLLARDAFEPYHANYKAKTIYAFNEIREDTNAKIIAKDAIYLKEGFIAHEGSNVEMKINKGDVITSDFGIKSDNQVTVYSQSIEQSIENTIRNNDIETLTVMDALGNIIEKFPEPLDFQNLNLSKFPEGFYLIEVKYISGSVEIRKF